ncbi:MAG: S9 family peptidase [Bacteroidetes bacterium]|nr:S9 family peptidase [Bacteroidota bacterium]
MKRIILLFATFCFLMISNFSNAQQLELPRILKWLDDENYLELKTEAKVSKVYKVNAKSGKSVLFEDLSYEDVVKKNLPEGFTLDRAAITTEDYKSVALIKDNNLYYYSRIKNKFKALTDNPSAEVTPEFSPDENRIAFTRDHDLYYIDIESGLEHRLTNDATDVIYNGYSSWVYMEEILGRATAHQAFWWSPDSKKIAFLRFDDTKVPMFPLYRADGIHGELELTRYPKVGDPNPEVKLGVIDLETKKLTWFDCNCDEDKYIAFPVWTNDSKKFFYQTHNREQNNLKIYLVDLASGEKKEIYNEKQEKYIEFYTDLYSLKDGTGFIVRSDKSGWNNLYHYTLEGKLVHQITNVNWRVNGIDNVDEKKGVVYFMGTGEKSIENHLFSVNMDGSKLTQLTKEAGTHRAMISPNNQYFIDTYSNISTPTRRELFKADGKFVRFLGADKGADPAKGEIAKVEIFTIPNPDGFDMPAWWVLPEGFDPAKKYGVVFQIYGGPDSKNVNNRYTNPQENYLTENGIIRFAVDHRGSGHFGKKGLNEFYGHLGSIDIQDYIVAVKWLIAQGFVDETKIGITGGSYGGYMTAIALTKGSDYFTHGFGSSAVIDWRLYDNVYTERYMGTLEKNKDLYEAGNVNNFADRLKGKLFMIHGTMDDNVHMQNIIQFVDTLTELKKDFQFMLYPNGRHGWGGNKRVHSTNLQKQFWLDNLTPDK